MRKHCWSFSFVLGILGIFLPLLTENSSSAAALLTVRGTVGPPEEAVSGIFSPFSPRQCPYLSVSGESHWKDFMGGGEGAQWRAAAL